MIDLGKPCQIIDIREHHEVDAGNIPASVHIPMADVLGRLGELRQDIPVIVYCKSGSRAAAMVHILCVDKKMGNVLQLEGGIESWAKNVNPKLNVF